MIYFFAVFIDPLGGQGLDLKYHYYFGSIAKLRIPAKLSLALLSILNQTTRPAVRPAVRLPVRKSLKDLS